MTKQFVWHVGTECRMTITRQRLVKRAAVRTRMFGPRWGWSSEKEWLADNKYVYDTFAEAKAAALAVCDRRVEDAKAVLHRCKTERGQIESMKEPT